jgi:hypothetical protein
VQTETAIDNPYWDAVCDHVGPDPYWPQRPFVVDWLSSWRDERMPRRTDFTKQYAWTITSPESVAFVAEHSHGRLVDPLAGTGYWAYLLDQAGVDVLAYDLEPPDGTDRNHYHRGQSSFAPVMKGDATEVVSVHSDRTLLLSWPPYGEPVGHRTLAAYTGDRVIYIGEGSYGCCGDDAMFDLFAADWLEVAEHAPIQWLSMHDYITVYDRNKKVS